MSDDTIFLLIVLAPAGLMLLGQVLIRSFWRWQDHRDAVKFSQRFQERGRK